LAQIKTVMSECFATLNASITGAGYDLSPLFVRSVTENIKLYEIDPASINYLGKFAPHLFHNKAAGQVNERKYIGVVLV